MSFPSLNELLCADDANVGGVEQAIFVLPARLVQRIPSANTSTHIVEDAIEVAGGQNFTKYVFDIDTVRFRSRQTRRNNTPVWEYEITGYRSKSNPDHQHEIETLANGDYIVQFRDNNNYPRLAGSISQPMRFESEADTGERSGDRNRVRWRFYGVSNKPALYFPVSVTLPSETALPVAKINITPPTVCNNNIGVSAVGSFLVDGTVISASTPGTTAMLKYTWRLSLQILLYYEASIAPNADPSVLGNWSIHDDDATLSFEDGIVNNIQAGGSGYSFSFDAEDFRDRVGLDFWMQTLQVIEGANESLINTKQITYEVSNRSFDCSFDSSFG